MPNHVPTHETPGSLPYYEIPQGRMGLGASIGNGRGWVTTGSDGRILTLFSTDVGKTVAGPLLVRYATLGMTDDGGSPRVPLTAEAPKQFEIHADYQRHRFTLPGGVSTCETVFLPQGEAGSDEDVCAAYYVIEMTNDSPRPHGLCIDGIVDLTGGRHRESVKAWHDDQMPGLLATRDEPDDGVRALTASVDTDGYALTTNRACLYDPLRLPTMDGPDSSEGHVFGCLSVPIRLEPGASFRFAFVLRFDPAGHNRATREPTTQLTRQMRDDVAIQKRSHDYYQFRLADCQLATPDPVINHGAFWAKVNMMRVLANYPQGEAFTNEPGVSSNVVVRDVAWFIYGCDHFYPQSSRNLLDGLVRCQKDNGQVPEYYNAITGQSEDYDLNISDPNPLFILAVNHHVRSTGDFEYLRSIYDKVKKAADYLLAQQDQRGLVFCTSTGVKEHGIASWRNVIPGGQISGAVTEINSECAAALRAMGHLAENLDRPREESDYYRHQADLLTQAIQTHLLDQERQLFLLNISPDGTPVADVTADELFPVLFRVVEDKTAYHIIRRLISPDFWTEAGLRTASRLDPHYEPMHDVGLRGGVWPGLTWWFAFAAARFYPELMVQALRASFEHYQRNPRIHQTVPGQFSEWFDGESLINRGMRLSPWEAPRFMWAAVEGIAGLMIAPGAPSFNPLRPASWQWTGLRRFWYHGNRASLFTVRYPDQTRVYTTLDLDPGSACEKVVYEQDLTDGIRLSHAGLHGIAFGDSQNLLIAVGSSRDQQVLSPLDLSALVQPDDHYLIRELGSDLQQWSDPRPITGQDLSALAMRVAGYGYHLLEITPRTKTQKGFATSAREEVPQ